MADIFHAIFFASDLLHGHCFVFDYPLTHDRWDKVSTLLLLRVALLAARLSPVFVLMCLLTMIFRLC